MNEQKMDLGMERTRMALMRTDFALMRTGFNIASFGAGIAQLLGRGVWPDWGTDGLTIVFMVTGMIMVQIGIRGSKSGLDNMQFDLTLGPWYTFLGTIAPWLLQAGLLFMLVLLLIY